LLLERSLRPEPEEVALAHREVDHLPRQVELHGEVVRRDRLDRLLDLLAQPVHVCAMKRGPLLRILEEAVDRAVRRGQTKLEANALLDCALVPEPLEDLVRLPGEAAVLEVVEARLLARLDAPVPEALVLLDR